MAKSKSKRDKRRVYAFYYPEGAGYLHIDDLAQGSQGTVVRVRSCADKQIYLRKRGKNIQNKTRQFDVGYGCDEVFYYRVHKLIPRLVDWTIYRSLPRTSPSYFDDTSTSTIWEYCKGGDLRELLQAYKTFNKTDGHDLPLYPLEHHIPEAFIWRLFGQLIQTLAFIHHANPPVCHLDIFLGNVFLRPIDDKLLPDCCLGDFGKARLLEPGFWDLPKTDSRRFRSFLPLVLKDYEEVISLVKSMMTLEFEQHKKETDADYLHRMEELFSDLEVGHMGDMMGSQESRSAKRALHLAVIHNRSKYQSVSSADGYSRYTPLLFDTIRQLEKRIREMKHAASLTASTHTGANSGDGVPRAFNFSYLGEAIERKAQDRMEMDNPTTYPAMDSRFFNETQGYSLPSDDGLKLALMTKAEIASFIDSKWPIGPFRIAKVDPDSLQITAISRKTYNSFNFSDQRAPTKSGVPRLERDDSQHSIAEDPTQDRNVLVTRNLSYNRFKQ